MGPGGFGGPPPGGGRGPGGPRGPMGGPRSFGGPSRWHGGPPPHTPVGNNSGGGEGLTSQIVGAYTDWSFAGQNRRRKFGAIKGTIMGLKLSTTGSFKEEMFFTKCKTADDLFKEKRITAEEMKKRKMDAAVKYHSYLRKIGFLDEYEYDDEMEEFAREIGATWRRTTRKRSK